MSNTINPFLYASHPYRDNPFDVLGIKEPAKATPALIQQYAKMVEEYAAQNLTRPSGRKDDKGEGGRAATALSDPVLRVAFDLMHSGIEILSEGK